MANDSLAHILEDLSCLAAETEEYARVEVLKNIVRNRDERLLSADLGKEENGAVRWLMDERVGKPYLQPCLGHLAGIMTDMVRKLRDGSK